MTARDVKDALRRRHPALPPPGFRGPGRWVTLEEWNAIDLLALDTWRSGEVIGYEVKVSRNDMRTELLNPSKRAAAVAMCTRFYFATPAGMLTPSERAFFEPDWTPSDFERASCTNPDCNAGTRRRGFAKRFGRPRGSGKRDTDSEGVSVYGEWYTIREPGYTETGRAKACCAVCRGYGTVGRSRVELEAPTLWIPRDVGLIVVGPGGCSVLREAPRRRITEPIVGWPFSGRRIPEEDRSRLSRQALAQFARWVSFRPDPRHFETPADRVDELVVAAAEEEELEPPAQDHPTPRPSNWAVPG